jgi:hypothetical protein
MVFLLLPKYFLLSYVGTSLFMKIIYFFNTTLSASAFK